MNNPFSDEPLLASLSENQQPNPYQSPVDVPGKKKVSTYKRVESWISHAFRCLLFTCLAIVGAILAGTIVIPEMKVLGWIGFALCLFSVFGLSKSVREWRTSRPQE